MTHNAPDPSRGYYAGPPASRGPSPLLVIVCTLILGAAGYLALRPSAPAAAPPVPAVADPPPRLRPSASDQTPPPATTGPDCTADRAELTAAISRIQQLEVALDAARAETAEHRAGLERAVAELNRRGGRWSLPPASPPPPRAAPSAGREQTNDGALVHTPDILDVFGEITVEGEVFNPHYWEIWGDVVVTVVRPSSGMVVETKRIPLTIAPGNRESYRAQLTNWGGDSRVDVDWEGGARP